MNLRAMINELKLVDSVDAEVNEKRLKKLSRKAFPAGEQERKKFRKERLRDFESQLASLEEGEWWRSQIKFVDS
jgi:hypothetical protein